MPTDNYTYEVETQPDGSITGKYSYYYEKWSMFSSEDDGVIENSCSYDDTLGFYTAVLNNNHYLTVTLDGRKIIENGLPTDQADERYLTVSSDLPCACGKGRFLTKWEPLDREVTRMSRVKPGQYVEYKETMHYKKFVREVTCEDCKPFYAYEDGRWIDRRTRWKKCTLCSIPIHPGQEKRAFRCSTCQGEVRQWYRISYQCTKCGTKVSYDHRRKTYDCTTCKKRQPAPPVEVSTPVLLAKESIPSTHCQYCNACGGEVEEQDIYTLCEQCVKGFYKNQ